MMHLWLKEIKGAVIKNQLTVSLGTDDAFDKALVLRALEEGVKALDLSMPVLLETHYRDFQTFYRTVFMPSDFIDAVYFDRLEAVIYNDTPKKKRI